MTGIRSAWFRGQSAEWEGTHDVADDRDAALDQIFRRLGLAPHHQLERLVPPPLGRLFVIGSARRRGQLDSVIRLVIPAFVVRVVQD